MKKFMAANWKMYKSWDEASQVAGELVELLSGKVPQDREVLVIPNFVAMKAVADKFSGQSGIFLGGQNFYPAAQGAYTGEISCDMLTAVGASYALAGHSERRQVMGESDEEVGVKTSYGLKSGLGMILCIGEKLKERKAGKVNEVLERQLAAGLKDVPGDVAPEKLVIAYEPVWAIGTGEVAGPREIAETHLEVRKIVQNYFSEKAKEIRILYGGSVKPGNCAEIIGLDNVDGVLVGGASLEATSFSEIVLA